MRSFKIIKDFIQALITEKKVLRKHAFLYDIV